MAKAEETTLRGIRMILSRFGEMSGLCPNNEKSSIFVASCTPEDGVRMAEAIGFPLEELPVRYLGVPLVSGQLRGKECQTLIDRITGRVSSCANTQLTYGGRLQLIKSVLVNIQAYWSSVYLLPKNVLRKINSILSQFLWKGKIGHRGGARVSWDQISQTYSRGGLDVPDLSNLNRALMLKTLWNICRKKESLWIKWVHQVILKGSTVWDYQPKHTDSWLVRGLMGNREKLRERTTVEIGDGKTTSFFNANWHQLGPLCHVDGIKHFQRRMMLPENAKVVDMVIDGKWWWDRENRRLDNVCQEITRQLGAPLSYVT